MLQAPVPEHAPDHPAKLESDAGAAVSLTVVPALNTVEQVWPQSMPAGLLITVPLPGPAKDIEIIPGVTKVAPTFISAFKTRVQFPVPEQAPDQPANEFEGDGAAVSVIEVPAGKLALQVVPQLIPAGALVTLPEPLGVTVRWNWVGFP